MLYNPRQDEVSRDLLAAASIIRDGGLCKGALWRDEQHCINGALIEAIYGSRDAPDWWIAPRVEAAQQRVCHHLNLSPWFNYNTPLVNWNNSYERTKDDVVNALCGAAGVTADVLV